MLRLHRIVCLLLALCLCFAGALPVSAGAQARLAYEVEGGNLYFDPHSGTIVDCDHTVTAAVIPPEIDGIAVTAIGDFAFDYCDKLGQLVIPNGVSSIGHLSFGYCYGLTEIKLPDSVTTIADQAFFDCTGVKKISLGSGILHIGRDAFWGTAYLRREENWEDALLYAGDVLLAGRDTLGGDLVLPEKTRVVAGSAFYTCTGLTSLTLPEGLVALGPECFYYCIGLTHLEIPDSVVSIGAAAFQYCAALQELEIGDGVERIEAKAFAFCGALQLATLGSRVEYIGDYVFSECDELQEIRFRGDAPELGQHPFDSYTYTVKDYAPIPGLYLCYRETASGWETPLWKGYPTKLWTPPLAFTDLLPGSWYVPAVDFVLARGLMQGMGEDSFAPDAPMTRAMLVTVLWRYAGQPEEGTNRFTDVPETVWYSRAVAWAAEYGIVTGIGGGRFDPEGEITREQLAVILYRYCKSLGIDTDAAADLGCFPDGETASPYAAEALSWAVEVGLVTGSASGGKVYLEPQVNATRAQVATILMRFIQNVVE